MSYDWDREIDTTDPGYYKMDAVDLRPALQQLLRPDRQQGQADRASRQ
jgi:hypothetical protein